MTECLAVVTGGSRGIGAATAWRLATEQWNVLLTYRSDEAAAKQVIDDCRKIGVWAGSARLDVAGGR